jgi:hypothetical protein
MSDVTPEEIAWAHRELDLRMDEQAQLDRPRVEPTLERQILVARSR